MVLDSVKLKKYERLKTLKEIGCFELISGEEVTGRVIELHSDYLVIAITKDFHFDGYAYIKYQNIVAVIDSESNTFYSKLFNNFCDTEPKLADLPTTYNDLLFYAAESQKLFIFELEDELHLGKVIKLEESTLYLEPLSSTGEFMGDFEIRLSEVLYIRGGSEYINAYAFYTENNIVLT